MKIDKNIRLSGHTTFKIGGPAKYFCEAGNESELLEAVEFAKNNKLPVFVLGEGSDILVNDEGFNGLVIKYTEKSLSFNDNGDNVLVTAGAGMMWDELVGRCVEKGLQGIECMSGIPGTTGAAPIQNIGAYGQEVKDTFYSLRAFDIQRGKFVSFNKRKCEFGYRDSCFKRAENWQKFIILNVTLKLRKENVPNVKYDSLKKYLEENNIKSPDLITVRKAVLDIRSNKFESYKEMPNAGSFFKNPNVGAPKMNELKNEYKEVPCFDNGDGTYKCFAGWFIEQSGWKGKSLGNARVSSKHALILLNPDGKAKANEVKKLADTIIKEVDDKFGVKLEKEVQYI